MRHVAIRRIAKCNASNSDYLRKLSLLLGNDEFIENLLLASRNPNDPRSEQINKKTLKLLSFAGKDVPFSPFERSQSKPKTSSLSPRFRF